MLACLGLTKILDCFILSYWWCLFFSLSHFCFSFFCFALLCSALPWIRTIGNSHAHFSPCIFIHSVCVWMQTFYHFISFVLWFVGWFGSSVRSFEYFAPQPYTPFHFVCDFCSMFYAFFPSLSLLPFGGLLLKSKNLNRIARFSLFACQCCLHVYVCVCASAVGFLYRNTLGMRECGSSESFSVVSSPFCTFNCSAIILFYELQLYCGIRIICGLE